MRALVDWRSTCSSRPPATGKCCLPMSVSVPRSIGITALLVLRAGTSTAAKALSGRSSTVRSVNLRMPAHACAQLGHSCRCLTPRPRCWHHQRAACGKRCRIRWANCSRLSAITRKEAVFCSCPTAALTKLTSPPCRPVPPAPTPPPMHGARGADFPPHARCPRRRLRAQGPALAQRRHTPPRVAQATSRTDPAEERCYPIRQVQTKAAAARHV